jgi:hypothetical protein
VAGFRRRHSSVVQAEYETLPLWIRYLSSSYLGMESSMKRALAAVAAAAVVGATVVTAPAPAEARGGRIAAGVIGGLAAGAIISGAYGAYGPRGPFGYYGPSYGYYGPSAVPASFGGCYWRPQQFWDGYGWRIRQVPVCS